MKRSEKALLALLCTILLLAIFSTRVSGTTTQNDAPSKTVLESEKRDDSPCRHSKMKANTLFP